MNKGIISFLVAASLLSSVSNAATQSKGKKKKQLAAQTTTESNKVSEKSTSDAVANENRVVASASNELGAMKSQVNESTISLADKKAEVEKKWVAGFSIESSSSMYDIRNEENAVIQTSNQISLGYKLSKKYSLTAAHNFIYVTESKVGSSQEFIAPLKTDRGANDNEAYATLPPMIKLGIKTEATLFGSKPISTDARYYIPIDQTSIEAKKNGVLRSDTLISWDFTPNLSFDFLASPRLYLNSKDAKNSDSNFRLIQVNSINYNFNDNISAYYAPQFDLRTTTLNRATAKLDMANEFKHEVGMNFQAGPVLINPAFVTSHNLDTGDGFMKDESSEIDLNISATF